MIADGLVIYRCYCIWNKNIYIVILPVVLLIVTTVFGLDVGLPANPFFILSLTTNILVTSMSAGRIWWIYHKGRAYLQADAQRRYVSALSILIESGVIYSATVLAHLVLAAIPSASTLPPLVFQMLTQIMGITPTLIIVRVGLGVHIPGAEPAVKQPVAKTAPSPMHKGGQAQPWDPEMGDQSVSDHTPSSVIWLKPDTASSS
ncbi:hypothetical protein B0H16DRAFT_1493702 [Mycena metata]|uniref:Uncharacterized protein n=1 Tax=Mycena metata TaxID=1033252 RepID=A0AAD7KFX3_9AGAR|nr:hypothetical protein B0H16DRAFT_1493702 [Mycena metata]